ncbi:hypothetical protein SAMN04490244_103164 [Tranquillimonas rosea]|uniref:Uncharacterized protein n=1 Tax=Tranquillimonas rosea TaxID=641238 RepID=A0A1H9SE24_9RHOB|nr:hypothetical protein [Tranquillimonas rosea]SER83296.1 hypothetical protein SAMN04490244_103164 [Tranquillimonas rosea]
MTLTLELALPLIVLAVAAAAVPLAICRVWPPRGDAGLALRGLLAALVLVVLAAGLFAVLYAVGGARLGAAAQSAPLASVWHFLWLGTMSALVWAPFLLLTILGLGRRLRAARQAEEIRNG